MDVKCTERIVYMMKKAEENISKEKKNKSNMDRIKREKNMDRR